VVDTPYEYGAIAAANSLSDVYAMGGQPFLALNIAALPEDLPGDIAGEILRGGAEKAREAGVVIAGGHTVKDKEPKYGLVVIGFIDPRKMISKGGFRPGDVLVLTKPLGTGVIATALKQEKVSGDHIQGAIESMSRLNKLSGQLAVEFELRGGTDITGFGLLGHGVEVAKASQVSLHIEQDKVPLLPGARIYAEKGIFPGGAFDNRKYFEEHVRFDQKLDEPAQMLLFDPQTSGGLLLGVPEEKLGAFQKRAGELGQSVWVIGQAHSGMGIAVR